MEILMLGDFGFLVSSLTFNVRDSISKEFDINRSYDSDRICFFKMIYILKDLRNAIAHNGVVYDTRFKKADINNTVRQCLIQEFRLPHVNFKDIIDYVALISFFLKHLKVTKSEIKRFINQIEKNVNGFLNKVGLPIAGPSFPNGWRQRLRLIINNL